MWPNQHKNMMANLLSIQKVHGYCFNPFIMLMPLHRLRKSTDRQRFCLHKISSLYQFMSNIFPSTWIFNFEKRGKQKPKQSGRQKMLMKFSGWKIFRLGTWSGLNELCFVINSGRDDRGRRQGGGVWRKS